MNNIKQIMAFLADMLVLYGNAIEYVGLEDAYQG